MLNEKITLESLLRKRASLKAFLFDLDGTLVDSQEGIITTIKEYLKSKGHDFGKERIAKLFGTPLEVIFKILIPNITEDEIATYLQEIRANYAKNHREITKVFPHTESLLKEIQSKGYKLGLASTKMRKFIVEILEHYNLLDYFSVIVSGYEVANHKPAPDILFETARQLQIDPADAIYVGDAPSDIVAGKKAGAITIAVLTGSHGIDQFTAVQPDFIIKDLSAIKLEK
ncbi:MAG: HAD family hydrolase [Candidatus Thorarchaeota archaeon]